MEEVVSRYASAIVSIAKDEGKLEQYKTAIFEVASALEKEDKLLKLLKSYFVKETDKFRVIDELCSSYKLDNLTNFMKLLVQKHQIFRFKDIAKEVNKGINEALNIYEGFVYSTEELSDERIAEVEEAISLKLKRRVELTNKIDSRLIGGIKVVVHDHVFDGSIKYKLETMKQELKERRSN